MKVAMYYSNNDIRTEEMPKPVVSRGELITQVKASGICGSDILEWYRIHKAPLVLGHEVAGIVSEAGEDVKEFKIGDRIVVAHHVPCGSCYYCKSNHETCCDTLCKTNIYPGGFSEYAKIPEINVKCGVFKIPENVSFEEAVLTEPLACVLRAQRIANLKKEQTLLVIGSGVTGLLHIKLAKSYGIKKIIATDINDKKLQFAKKYGASIIINAKDAERITKIVKENNDGRLADIVMLCTGAISAIKQGLSSIERGGTVMFFAPTDKDVIIPISVNDLFFRNDVTLTTSYAGSPKDYEDALGLIAKGKVKVRDMITDILSFDEAVKGFKLVSEAKDSIKVVLKP